MVTRYNGTLVALIGPPGCGKTYNGTWLAFQAAIRNALPILAIDPNGDSAKYRDGFIAYAREHGNDSVADWLVDKRFVKLVDFQDSESALGLLSHFIESQVKKGVDSPSAVYYVDELGVIRREDETFQSKVIPRARNAGVLVYGTGHAMTDITPPSRNCLRAVVLWKTQAGYHDVFGAKVGNEKLADAQSETLTYVIPTVPGKVFRCAADNPDEVLTQPVYPTGKPERKLG